MRKLIYKFYQMRQYLTLMQLKIVYYTLVESIIGFGILSWGAACNSILNKLEKSSKIYHKDYAVRFSTALNDQPKHSIFIPAVHDAILIFSQKSVTLFIAYCLPTCNKPFSRFCFFFILHIRFETLLNSWKISLVFFCERSLTRNFLVYI